MRVRIGELLDHLRGRFEVAPSAEVTCEANPDTVDEETLRSLRSAGIGRLSLGVQSFDPAVLGALERVHPPSSARDAYEAARAAGFDDVNLDLIYGAHGETLDSWVRTLEEAVALGPAHHVAMGVARFDAGRFRLTEQGMFLANEVVLALSA